MLLLKIILIIIGALSLSRAIYLTAIYINRNTQTKAEGLEKRKETK